MVIMCFWHLPLHASDAHLAMCKVLQQGYGIRQTEWILGSITFMVSLSSKLSPPCKCQNIYSLDNVESHNLTSHIGLMFSMIHNSRCRHTFWLRNGSNGSKTGLTNSKVSSLMNSYSLIQALSSDHLIWSPIASYTCNYLSSASPSDSSPNQNILSLNGPTMFSTSMMLANSKLHCKLRFPRGYKVIYFIQHQLLIFKM